MLRKTVEKYSDKAFESAEWVETDISEGSTAFDLTPDSVGVRYDPGTIK